MIELEGYVLISDRYAMPDGHQRPRPCADGLRTCLLPVTHLASLTLRQHHSRDYSAKQ